MNNQKNTTLELLKLFASYMVVFIHVLFSAPIGIIIDALARFAVPFFFLISGFYSYQINSEKIKKRIRKTFTLFIFAIICYTLFYISLFFLKGNIDGIFFYFNRYFDLEILFNLFIFNDTVNNVHLWYLLAITYVYITFYFVTVFKFNKKALFIISLLLLFLHILLGEFLSVFGIVTPIYIVRNFALMGIPFFSLGLFAKKYMDELCVIPNYVIVIVTIIGIFESILSRYFFGKNELYIGSLFILFAIVTVFVKYSSVKYPHFLNSLADYSTYIYIFHMMISSAIIEIYPLLNIDYSSSVIIRNLHPIFVCIASTAFAYCITKTIKLLQKQK